MLEADLSRRYNDYIDCLNQRDWKHLKQFVAEDVRYNDQVVGFSGYLDMLEGNCRDIPDLRFVIELLVCEPLQLGCRLRFDCTPVASFLGLQVNGRRVSFTENVFYQFEDGRIAAVWSIVDKAAIEAQL